MTRNQIRVLAIAWTVLSIAALGSVILAVWAGIWPIAFIQVLVFSSTSFMAYTRWRTL